MRTFKLYIQGRGVPTKLETRTTSKSHTCGGGEGLSQKPRKLPKLRQHPRETQKVRNLGNSKIQTTSKFYFWGGGNPETRTNLTPQVVDKDTNLKHNFGNQVICWNTEMQHVLWQKMMFVWLVCLLASLVESAPAESKITHTQTLDKNLQDCNKTRLGVSNNFYHIHWPGHFVGILHAPRHFSQSWLRRSSLTKKFQNLQRMKHKTPFFACLQIRRMPRQSSQKLYSRNTTFAFCCLHAAQHTRFFVACVQSGRLQTRTCRICVERPHRCSVAACGHLSRHDLSSHSVRWNVQCFGEISKFLKK